MPSSKITMLGALFTSRATIVSWRCDSCARAVTSPDAVPTRTVTGMRNTAGVVKRRPVLSALEESCCVCCTTSETVDALESYFALTVNSG